MSWLGPLILALTLTLSAPALAGDSVTACGMFALIAGDLTDFTEQSTNCPFSVVWTLDKGTGVMRIEGEHFVARMLVPPDDEAHWLVYRWRTYTATINGAVLVVAVFSKYSL